MSLKGFWYEFNNIVNFQLFQIFISLIPAEDSQNILFFGLGKYIFGNNKYFFNIAINNKQH